MNVTLASNADIWEITNKLMPMIWERVIAVYNGRGFEFPKVVAGKTFGWKYTAINIPADSYMALLLGTTRPIGTRENVGTRFWTRTYPFEIHTLSDTPQMPESIRPNPLYARFTSRSFTPENELDNDLKIFQWTNPGWVQVTNDAIGRPIDPTLIEELGPPQPGDYVLHLWANWIAIINVIAKIYIKKPIDFNIPFEPLGTKIKRYFPQEKNGIYPSQNYPLGSYYSDALQFGKLFQRANPEDVPADQGPTIVAEDYGPFFDQRNLTPHLGDYFIPQLIDDILETLRGMKYTQEKAESFGDVKIILYDDDTQNGHFVFQNETRPYDTVGGISPRQTIENGQYAGGFIKSYTSSGGAIGGFRENYSHIYGNGRFYIDRSQFVPTPHTNHTLGKYSGSGTYTHNKLSRTSWTEIEGVFLSGLDFVPVVAADDWGPYLMQVDTRSYTEWSFEYE